MLQEKKDTAELQEQSKQLKKDKEATEELVKEVEAARDKAIIPIGNLVPDSVPISKDEVGLCCVLVCLEAGGRSSKASHRIHLLHFAGTLKVSTTLCYQPLLSAERYASMCTEACPLQCTVCSQGLSSAGRK